MNSRVAGKSKFDSLNNWSGRNWAGAETTEIMQKKPKKVSFPVGI